MKLIIDIPEKAYKLRLTNPVWYDSNIDKAIREGTPLEDIVAGIESHKWGNNEGSKEIYNNAIDDVLTYIEEKLGE